ncbi:MAG: D-fructose-6-phosphate amidotransferase [Opitutaceae bacterium]|nr:D-fructose-6-phosphate amidotransferase [Opitutaceae bacterium]|tara:strand:+ start:326 stop:643 length:318 start_codon:yes stop_codon:yes gene_type:complete
MPVYTISDIQVTNWERYEHYVRQTRAIAEKFGGKYHIRGGEIKVVAGDWKPNRLIVIEFPSMEALVQFRDSPEYQPAAEIRKGASNLISSIVVEGYDGESDNIGG